MRLAVLTLLGVAMCFEIIGGQPARPEIAMKEAAGRLLETLEAAQREKIRWPFESEQRLDWHFIPRERKGISLKEMTGAQRAAAFDLLRAGLSASGFTKAETIRSLENVLRALGGSVIRDPELYFFTIFGDPTSSAPWGWRYEGHHISQNWTIAGGKAIATTPAFFGANPAEVREGPLKGTRALANEEDLARALLESLTAEQRREAIVDDTAPPDIVTGNSRKAAIAGNAGLAASAMSARQQALLMRLIEEHASSQPPALSEARLERARAAGLSAVRFAWMGSEQRGRGHYYRIQGTTFLIEYDNTQNDANHQHVVWRDFDGDFGLDMLGRHYASDPHHAKGARAR
jgi:hypothetical protein